MKNAMLISGCPGEECGWNTQLLYFTGSSLSRDDKSLFLISDRDGLPNVIVRDLATGTERALTQNRNGVMKSYVYFDCNPGKGLSKASVCLDADRSVVYFIQDNTICKVGMRTAPRWSDGTNWRADDTGKSHCPTTITPTDTSPWTMT